MPNGEPYPVEQHGTEHMDGPMPGEFPATFATRRALTPEELWTALNGGLGVLPTPTPTPTTVTSPGAGLPTGDAWATVAARGFEIGEFSGVAADVVPGSVGDLAVAAADINAVVLGTPLAATVFSQPNLAMLAGGAALRCGGDLGLVLASALRSRGVAGLHRYRGRLSTLVPDTPEPKAPRFGAGRSGARRPDGTTRMVVRVAACDGAASHGWWGRRRAHRDVRHRRTRAAVPHQVEAVVLRQASLAGDDRVPERHRRQ